MKKRALLWLVTVFKAIYRAIYAPMKLRPLQNKVVMISRQSDELRPDFTQIGEELARLDGSVKIEYLCRKIGDTFGRRLSYGLHLLHCAWAISTARVCVVDGYSITVSVLRHRPQLYVLQVWHALGAIKKFGQQTLDLPGGRDPEIARRMNMHENYDAVLSAGRRTAKIYAEAFGVPEEKVLTIGVPRVDAILRMNPARCRRRFFAAYPGLRGKKNVLYVPTFREGCTPDLGPILEAARAAGVNLIVRLHPIDRERVAKHPEALAFLECRQFGTFTLMAAADAVITDYSAIAIEASLLPKPVYFYVYDVEAYSARHGLNYDPLEEMPACASRDFAELLRRILEEPYDFEALRRFSLDFVETRDTASAARIASLIMEHLKGGKA